MVVEYSPALATIYGLSDAVEIAAGSLFTCARRATGAVVCWGNASEGALGNGAGGGIAFLPVGVTGLTDAVEIAAGGDRACARRASGAVVCWGSNFYDQLGDGMTGGLGFSDVPVAVVGLSDAVEVAAGPRQTCARRASGAVVCWGDNSYDQLGSVTSSAMITTPAAVSGLTDAIGITAGGLHTCARRASDAVVCWGYNSSYQLGNTAPIMASSPIPVTDP
jgi:alpha-tubulin suppressor-like RCC1 family protein